MSLPELYQTEQCLPICKLLCWSMVVVVFMNLPRAFPRSK